MQCPSCSFVNSADNKFCAQCGASLTGATGQLNPDTALEGRYIILKTIGRGGMGAVYMALDSRLNNIPVAIKEMSTQAVGGDLQAAIAAFQKEASLLISLRHPALPVIRDFFPRGEDRWYLVMDYIEGRNLKEIVDQRGPIPEAEVLDWAEQLCTILDYLHSRTPPVIFRDLKPSNIMLTPEGQIKLIDFGIARHFRQGSTADTSAYGSHGFAAPEQYGQNQTDPRSDIYALGATLHYLLTGIDPTPNPFNFDPPSQHSRVSPRMETAIMKALELRAENRPQDVREVLNLMPRGTTTTTFPFQKKSTVTSRENLPRVKKGAISDLSATTPMAGTEERPEVQKPVDEHKTVPMDNLHDNRTVSARAIKKKSGKARNIIISACLAIALVAGGVYSYYQHVDDSVISGITDKTDEQWQKASLPVVNNELANDELEIPASPGEVQNQKQTEENGKLESSPQKIIFNDPGLEEAVRERINKPQGEVYADDLTDIRKLYVYRKEIKNISALQYFTNLERLELPCNHVSNISYLRSLTKLKVLNLGYNEVTDISVLGELTSLQSLNLYSNPISNISSLRRLTNLWSLDLSSTQINDISALSSLSNLQCLYISGNQISDISALSNLSQLRELYLSHNPISDYSPVESYYENLVIKDFEL